MGQTPPLLLKGFSIAHQPTFKALCQLRLAFGCTRQAISSAPNAA
jgi:hypothetical protein